MSTSDPTSNPDPKRCSACGEWKSRSEFSRNARCKDGLSGQCKACRKIADAKYRETHREQKAAKDKAYYERNREDILAYHKEYYQENREDLLKEAAEYQKAHPEVHRKADAKYAKTHKETVNCRSRKFKATHREYIAEYNVEYKSKNRAAIKIQRAQHYDENREEIAQYRKDNPHIGRLGRQRRIARIHGLPADFNAEDERKMLEYFNHRCAVCGRPRGLWHTLALDHWIPVSDPRPDNPGTVPWNIVPLCHATKGGEGSCNKEKLNRDPHEWLVSKYGPRKAMQIEKRIQEYFDSVRR